ncbi:DNA recombination protein RmuC [Neptuniibacter sp. QD37_11]|uniref:DNA recombination protein RmuC n=1 Tax=Neptuniibacter sp. QD37_11 TaxID=3398209 RepID=UPI0039F4A5D9
MPELLASFDLNSLLLGVLITGCLFFFIYRHLTSQKEDLLQQVAESETTIISLKAKLETELAAQQSAYHEVSIQKARIEERLHALEPRLRDTLTEKHQLDKRLEQTKFELADRNEVIADLEARYEATQEAHSEKLQVLEQARQQLKQEFQNLANRIFEEKAQRFTQSNQENMGHLLTPLKEQLGEFKRRVEDVYDKESKDRRALYEQISHLKQLNQQMSEDAINLTQALKGENKTQGNWGEVVLERALEESGLRKGYEFELQVSASVQGKRYQPDAVIHLPDGKDVIVDSKVSLTAYEQYCSTEDKDLRERMLREHLISMRGHIKGLSDKAYQGLEGIRSLDFVLLFIPVEGAFLLALEKEPNLFKEAFDRNIMLVSPATLMVTLRTIHNIWRYEHQNQNAQEIARRGGELYDKFVGFIDALDEVGRNLQRTQAAFDTANKRLSTGRGNLVSQVTMLQSLGADGKKKLNSELVERALESDQ